MYGLEIYINGQKSHKWIWHYTLIKNLKYLVYGTFLHLYSVEPFYLCSIFFSFLSFVLQQNWSKNLTFHGSSYQFVDFLLLFLYIGSSKHKGLRTVPAMQNHWLPENVSRSMQPCSTEWKATSADGSSGSILWANKAPQCHEWRAQPIVLWRRT